MRNYLKELAKAKTREFPELLDALDNPDIDLAEVIRVHANSVEQLNFGRMLTKNLQITQQVESRYKTYLKRILREAKKNFNGGGAEEYMN